MSRNYFFILFLLITVVGFSQKEEYIFGQLVDSTKNEAIAFASIILKNKALGTITNIDGTFKIPLRLKELGEVIEISSMGYKSKELLLEDLGIEKGNIIILEPALFELNEAVVSANIKSLSAKQIVRIAVNSIPQNHPPEAFGIIGYYRDYQVKNSNYTNLNEAIIKMTDKGSSATDILDNQYQIYSYNQNTDFELDDFASQPYDYDGFNKVIPNAKLKNDGGNEFITLQMHDAIRNYGMKSFSFVDDMDSDFINNHRFRLKGKTSYGEETVYEIHLSYRNDKYRAEGKIFVNTDDYAIHNLDYAVFKRKQPGNQRTAVNEKERYTDGFKKMNSELLYLIRIEYVRGSRNSMYLNYISFYNKVLIQRPAEFKSKFILNLDDRSFRVRMNKIPVRLDKIKERDFEVYYKDQIIPIKEFYFLEYEKTFVVCPYLDKGKSKAVTDHIFTQSPNMEISDIKYSYNNMEDDLGNELDERKLEYVHQYREFFSQEFQLMGSIIDSTHLMNKTLPLDDPLQPVATEELKNRNWKNTPLPNLKD